MSSTLQEPPPVSGAGNSLAAPKGSTIYCFGMPWATQEFTREQVNSAGLALLKTEISHQDYFEALEAVNNWRAIHGCPLQSMRMTLEGRAMRVDSSVIVSQRTKRIPAIRLKLRENHARGLEMKLSQMHDIGGCRAVFRNVAQVEQLVAHYKAATAKNASRSGVFHREYDYIQVPKETGYRSVHLVYRYQSDSKKLRAYNGLKIEIQLRSRLQHYWATAVETVDFFTGQALKSNIGDLPWKRFFILVSNEFARLEKRPLVPGAPVNENEAKAELLKYSNQIKTLEGFKAATRVVTEKGATMKDTPFFLLQLDLDKRLLKATPFSKTEATKAQHEYAKREANSDPENIQTVLVSVKSIKALPKAYPSFYLDITEFVKVLDAILAH
ncbi:MAG TPA: RelA/SpoT domain-containing protein [Lacunisphaera sp.]|nr:RelA/SpoT domain-containing protein [Lacunisphaera sp.]